MPHFIRSTSNKPLLAPPLLPTAKNLSLMVLKAKSPYDSYLIKHSAFQKRKDIQQFAKFNFKNFLTFWRKYHLNNKHLSHYNNNSSKMFHLKIKIINWINSFKMMRVHNKVLSLLVMKNNLILKNVQFNHNKK